MKFYFYMCTDASLMKEWKAVTPAESVRLQRFHYA